MKKKVLRERRLEEAKQNTTDFMEIIKEVKEKPKKKKKEEE